MKFFQSSLSPNSRRVRIFLAEKGITIPTELVDLGAKAQFSDAYRAINSRFVVPTLVLDDGTSIGEVLAIWRYLEETHPKFPLLGLTAKDKALVTMWERRAELDGFAAVMEAVRNTLPVLKDRALAGPHNYEQIPPLAERSVLRARNFYADLNSRLAEVPFVAGDAFSAADITAVVTVDFARTGINLPIPEEHASLRRWYDTVSARPSAKA
jgi:glutathione S-transferase